MALSAAILLPEIILFFGALGVLMLGAFQLHARALFYVSVGLLGIAMLVSVAQTPIGISADGQFVMDGFAALFKLVCYGGCIVALLSAMDFLEQRNLLMFEFPALVLLAATGMGVMIVAHDLLTLYLGLELQSLSLYILASLNRPANQGSEAGVKYFVLGALASGFLLYGASLLYGFAGGTQFADLNAAAAQAPRDIVLIVGLVFFLVGLAFKISAVPFHMWTPDVYQGALTPVTGFFAVAPKVAAMALLLRFLFGAMGDAILVWQQMLVFLALSSIVLGAAAAIGQSSIKRLLAYSSIGNMGYVLLGLVTGTPQGVGAAILYLLLYAIMTMGVFACILALRDDDGAALDDSLGALTGLSQRQPFVAFCLGVLMFSLAGIPPLAGFFAKFVVFRALVETGFVILAIAGIVTSVMAAVYYLKIIKVMYLDAPTAPSSISLASPMLGALAGTAAAAVLLFVLVPGWAIDLAGAAAASLMGTQL